MDIKIINGDIPALSVGGDCYISGIYEAVQRVRITALTEKGKFRYDRELGVDYGTLSTGDPLFVEKLDMLIKEACCDIGDTEVDVLSCPAASRVASIRVTYKGSPAVTEVDLSGILQ